MRKIQVNMLRLFVLIGLVEIFKCDTRVTVVDSECGGTYSPDDGDLYLFYHGDTLSGCTFLFKTNDAGKQVCAYFEKMDISSCATTIQFYSGYTYSKSKKRYVRAVYQTFSCSSERMTEYCQALVTQLSAEFKHDGLNTSDEVRIKITYEKDNTYVYIAIPFVAVAVIFVVVIVIFVVRKIRRQRRQSNETEPAVGVFTTF